MVRLGRFAAAGATAALLAGSGVAATTAIRATTGRGVTSGPNANRFLTLTGGADHGHRPTNPAAAGATTGAGGRAGNPGLAGARPNCGTAPTTPAGWCLRPSGTQFDVLRFPIGLAVDPSSGDAVVSSDSGGNQAIAVVDPAAPDAHAAVTFSPGANLFLGLSVTSNGTIYASGGNADRVFRYHLAGPLAVPEDPTQAAQFPTHNLTNGMQSRLNGGNVQAAPVGDGIHVPGYPGESVSDGAHHLVFVGGTLSEPSGPGPEACPGKAPACARVSVIDTNTDTVVTRIAVGADTYGLALDTSQHKLFVANWGDQASRGNGHGTVSVLPLDPGTGLPGAETTAIPVGHHPEAVALSSDKQQRFLYVTDTNDDTVTVIDTASNAAIGTLDVGVPGHFIGTQPDALAVAPDGRTLFVALAGLNAVQAIGLSPAGLPSSSPVTSYLPTGWYPAALAAVPGPNQGTRLWVANAKGIGFGPGGNGSVLFEGTTTGGTVSMIDLPAHPAKVLASGTATVISNDGLNENPDPCAATLTPSPVLCPGGMAPSPSNPSPIRHVVYMLVENKTFDSYFGDINPPGSSAYNADPKFLLFGQPVTTNQHNLAAPGLGVLGDNFYSDAEVSVTGHSYASGALATDHNEKTWPADYDQGIRGTRGSGDPLRPTVASPSQSAAIDKVESALYDPQGGFLFERFKEAGAVDPATKGAAPDAHPLSMAIYGEHSTTAAGPEYHAKWTKPDGSTVDWKAGDIQYFDSCRALLFDTGSVGGGTFPDSDQTRDCEHRQLDPQFTLSHWTAVKQTTGKDVMPNFIFMSLPDNHTLGTNLGSPTPQSMVADNDYAIGTIVQALSSSPFWSSTAVVIVQDDTQATGDHVDPLRDTLEVVGPWAATAPDHQRGSMGSVLRTIELLFGVKPVGINDELAAPLHGAFLGSGQHPHAFGYTAVRPLVPFALNQPGAPGQAASMAMDWTQVDRIDMATLNAIWWATQHHTPFKPPSPAHPRATDGNG